MPFRRFPPRSASILTSGLSAAGIAGGTLLVATMVQAAALIRLPAGTLELTIAAGVVGTWLGLRLLKRLTDRRFDGLLKWVLTLLALRLLWLAAEQLL